MAHANNQIEVEYGCWLPASTLCVDESGESVYASTEVLPTEVRVSDAARSHTNLTPPTLEPS